MGIGESRLSQIHSSAMVHLRELLFPRPRGSPGAPQISIMSVTVQRRIRANTLMRHVTPMNGCAQKLAG